MPTHKKGHDKDKYYHLAKDQGYRSRAAFKLIQIDKRFDFLKKARVCLDLCAAPGGWCQVAAKYMPTGSIVIGVDLLPIRAIRGVKTFVADITTAECRKLVSNELQGWKADVVLCDGAPNIGSAYQKDAYVQNELVIAALKTATDHLAEGGTFCTKVYRSVDYNAVVWVLRQLFEDVQAMKPNSSRSQSSEIFLVCSKYTAPKKIDPKLLDPNHIFKEVQDPGLKPVDVMHKKYEKLNRRHRTGYDESLGPTLRSTVSVSEFIASTDPVRVLSDNMEFVWSPDCEQYKEHAKTTSELIECFKDLKVLGKLDFKKILRWRQAIRAEEQEARAAAAEASGEKKKREEVKLTEDEQIEQELAELRAKKSQLDRKEKKRAREKSAKERSRQAAGINGNAFSVSEDVELFSLGTVHAATDGDVDIDEIRETTLGDENEELALAFSAAQGEDPHVRRVALGDHQPSVLLTDEDLEAQLESDYLRYVGAKKKRAATDNDDQLENEKSNKRKRVDALKARKTAHEVEDDEFYAEQEPGQSDNDEEDDEGFDSDYDEAYEEEEDLVEQAEVRARAKKSLQAADTWFSHPLFQETIVGSKQIGGKDDTKDDITDEDDTKAVKGKAKSSSGRKVSAADEMLAMMPKTDKEIRSAKRKKQKERMDRRAEKRAKALDLDGEAADIAFSVVQKDNDAEDDEDGDDAPTLTPEEMARRDLLLRGMGKLGPNSRAAMADAGSAFEIVRRSADTDSVEDDDEYTKKGRMSRSYDSDEEDYDAHDLTMQQAIGTLMLQPARKKALIDASYNRYSWNDEKDLPSWFMEDEMMHNKPQLPVPTALLDQIRGKFQLTGTKEIKKVAEARARKRKRALNQLAKAKKKANALAENPELSGREKVKAIARAMKGAKGNNTAKIYVVTKKTGAGSVGTRTSADKGKLKFVDKRMKKDARAARAIKKRSKK